MNFNYLYDIDHHPFGMVMSERSYSSGDGYRYGFNGMEKDDEVNGEGNSLDFGARIYDSRVGRWMSLDPLYAKYASFTPYSFVQNSPIIMKDQNGEEGVISIKVRTTNGAIVLLTSKKVEGHVVRQGMEVQSYAFGLITEEVKVAHAFNYKQEIIIDAATGKLEFGSKEVDGKSKGSAPYPFMAETRAKLEAEKKDEGKDLLESFNIKSADGVSRWLIDNLNQTELSEFINDLKSATIPQTAWDDDKNEYVTVTPAEIELELSLKEMVEKEFDTRTVHCEYHGANYKVSFYDSTATNIESDKAAEDTMKAHDGKQKFDPKPTQND